MPSLAFRPKPKPKQASTTIAPKASDTTVSEASTQASLDDELIHKVFEDIHKYEVDEFRKLAESEAVSFDIDASSYHPYDWKTGISSSPRGKYKKKNAATPQTESDAKN